MYNNQNTYNYVQTDEIRLQNKTQKNISNLENLASLVKAGSIIVAILTLLFTSEMTNGNYNLSVSIVLITNLAKTIATGFVVGSILEWCANMLELSRKNK